MRVGNHLRLDMARLVEELLDKAFATTESRHGLAHGGCIQLGHFVHAPGDLHAAATAAKSSLDDDGQTMLLGKGQHFISILDGIGRAGHQRRTDLQRNLARLDLVAQLGDGVGARADPDQTRIQHGLCKGFALGQKAIAGMHGIGARTLGNRNQLGDVQIGVGGLVALEAVGPSARRTCRASISASA